MQTNAQFGFSNYSPYPTFLIVAMLMNKFVFVLVKKEISGIKLVFFFVFFFRPNNPTQTTPLWHFFFFFFFFLMRWTPKCY